MYFHFEHELYRAGNKFISFFHKLDDENENEQWQLQKGGDATLI